jgi:hypothetical protein
MAKNNIAVILIIGAIVLVALGVFKIPGWGSTTDNGGTPTGGSECEQNPLITVSAVNAILQGTSITPVVYARINDNYYGAITSGNAYGGKGDKVELLYTEAGAIGVIKKGIVLGCGNNVFTEKLYRNTSGAFTIYNSGNSQLTDAAAGGATNQSSFGAAGGGSAVDLEMRISTDNDKSTGDMVIVVEATNTTQVDRLVLSGFPGVTKVAVPKFYVVQAAGSVVEAYQISPVSDGATATGFLKISAESGQTVDKTAVYVTGYIPNGFVDDDGTFKVGIEDSDGTQKSLFDFDYDFMVD